MKNATVYSTRYALVRYLKSRNNTFTADLVLVELQIHRTCTCLHPWYGIKIQHCTVVSPPSLSVHNEATEKMSIKQCCGLGHCVVTKGLLDCASCKAISYCGRAHQVEHFKNGHKLVCPGREKPLSFASCVEKATRYYNEKMWVAGLPYYSALLVSRYRIFQPC